MEFFTFHRCFALSLLALFCGCSGAAGDAGRVDAYEVTGTVKMSGAPVANAAVTFAPAGNASNQPVALGRTDSGGNFTLTTYDAGDGAAAGDYIVLVSKPTPAAATSDPAAMHAAMSSGQAANMHSARQSTSGEASSALPERYGKLDQSDLKATVKPEGENHFDLVLTP